MTRRRFERDPEKQKEILQEFIEVLDGTRIEEPSTAPVYSRSFKPAGEPGGVPENDPPDQPPPFVPKHFRDTYIDFDLAMLARPFPRTEDLSLGTDEETGQIVANVPHLAFHYVPDALVVEAEQYAYGPQAAGSPGLYELGLSVMAHFMPVGSDGLEAVDLRTARPNPNTMPISGTAWDLHREFAEEILLDLPQEDVYVPATLVYAWILAKFPELEQILTAEPTRCPFDEAF